MDISEELRAEHDRFMATPPVEYRGYFLKPISHINRPYLDSGKYTFFGWVVIDNFGCNAAPGATWGKSLEQAKKIVDCLYAAGLSHEMSFDERLAWRGSEEFWRCMRT